jgi:hypothetical protein
MQQGVVNMSEDKSVANRGESAPATSQLDAFLAEIKELAGGGSSGGRGRIIFALDATASRQPSWDTACQLQADMFREAASAGGLDLQLVYYRGLNECKASKWISDPLQLGKTMSRIMCDAGHTQIEKILIHAKKETMLLKVNALVFVGDATEENPDTLAHEAGELGRRGVPAFMFQEGRDREVEQVFREIARLTRGAYCRFDQGSARELGQLLRAVAVFAVGGAAALSTRNDAASIKLLGQMR